MVREMFAILIVVLLIGFGWKQPFERHLQNITGTVESSPTPSAKPVRAPVAVRPAATVLPVAAQAAARTPEKTWMWKQTPMDQPYNASSGRGR